MTCSALTGVPHSRIKEGLPQPGTRTVTQMDPAGPQDAAVSPGRCDTGVFIGVNDDRWVVVGPGSYGSRGFSARTVSG